MKTLKVYSKFELFRWICLLRHKTYSCNISSPAYLSFSQVAKFLKISATSAQEIYKTFVQDSNNSFTKTQVKTRKQKAQDFASKLGRRKLTTSMLNFLKEPSTLKSWAGYSLDERAVFLHRQFPQTRITGNYIGKLYKKFKIKRKAVIIRKKADPKLLQVVKVQAKQAKAQLDSCKSLSQKIYYLDEAMFTTRQYQNREFACQNDNVELSQKHTNMKAIAFLGVVSQD